MFESLPATYKNFNLRFANPADNHEIYNLFNESIYTLCGPHYSAEALTYWNGRRTLEKVSAWIENKDFYFVVAESLNPESSPIRLCGLGFISTKSGILHACYIHPSSVGKGLGTQIANILIEAGKNSGHSKIFLRATLNAETFYRKLGFHSDSRLLNISPPEDVPHIRMSLVAG